MSGRIDSRLVVDALEMVISHRLPGAGLMAHSDRGSHEGATTKAIGYRCRRSVWLIQPIYQDG